MLKIKILLTLLLSLFLLSNTYANDDLYSKLYFRISETKIDLIKEKVDELLWFQCEDSNSEVEPNIIFTCDKNFNWKSGCGIKLTDYVYERKYNCSLYSKKTWKQAPLSFYVADAYSVITKVSPYENVDMSSFPTNIDITGNFYKKSLQDKMLSCESSATSDILSTLLQKTVTEDDVIAKLDKSWYNQRSVWKDWVRIWWNPNEWFVWYIDKNEYGVDAQQYNYDGYGVLEKPIAKVYNKYGFETSIITEENHTLEYTPKDHLFDLLWEINRGNYVQLWWDWCTNPAVDDGKYKTITDKQANEWYTAKNTCVVDYRKSRNVIWYYEDENGEKQKHVWLNWEHAFYLLGYKWGFDNPTHVIVWDTYSGKHTYTYDEWMRKWSKMQYRSVIIYSK